MQGRLQALIIVAKANKRISTKYTRLIGSGYFASVFPIDVGG